MRPIAGIALAVAVAASGSCRRDPGSSEVASPDSDGSAAPEALRLLPGGPLLVAVTPAPARLAQRAGWPDILEADTATRAELSAVTRELVGVDVVELPRWGEFGIDLDAPAGMVLYPGAEPRWVFFVELADPYRFQEYLHDSAARWMGPIDSRTEGHALIVTGSEDEVGLVVRGRHAFAVVAAPSGERDALLSRIANQGERGSLASEPGVARLAATDADATLYVGCHRIAELALAHADEPAEAAVLRSLLDPMGVVTLALRFEDRQIAVRGAARPAAGSLPDRLLSGEHAPAALVPVDEFPFFLSIASQPKALIEAADLLIAVAAQGWGARVGGAAARSFLADIDGGAAVAAQRRRGSPMRWWLGLGSADADSVASRLDALLPVRRVHAADGGAWLLIAEDDAAGTANPGPDPGWDHARDTVALLSLTPAAFATDGYVGLPDEPLPREARVIEEPHVAELVRRHDALEQELAEATRAYRAESERYSTRLARQTGRLELRVRRDGKRVLAEGGQLRLPDGARGALSALLAHALELRTRERMSYELARDQLWDVQSQLWTLRHEIDAAVGALDRKSE